MASKNIICVSEFEKLYYDNSKPFKQKHWEVLCRYLDNANKREDKRIEYFRILNKGIQFTNYVGVIQAGNLTIEVLPKTDKGATTATNQPAEKLEPSVAADKQKWQKVLLQMLRECRLLRVNQVDYAQLNLRSNSILDIYLELFLSEAEQLLHEGLLKQYRREEGNHSALKGSLQFGKQATLNATHAERFYVRYTEYNANNVYNQLLYATLQLIRRITNSSTLTDRVSRLLLHFPQTSTCIPTEETFNRLRFDRKTERYKEALLISKMLLLNFRPDITGGAENVIAILFDMNKLWEEWVYRRLKKEETAHAVIIKQQQSTDFWEPQSPRRMKTIRPDIVLSGTGCNTIVIDTKWKILDDLMPSDADLKQMFTYNLFWKCTQSILLYPSNNEGQHSGAYVDFNNQEKHHSHCRVQTISILDNKGGLRADFAASLFQLILG